MKKYRLKALTIIAIAMFLSSITSANAADCSITSTLKVGARGADVACLQSTLGLRADGIFGPMTKSSVMSWQYAHGLTADGVFGPLSRSVWTAINNTPTPIPQYPVPVPTVPTPDTTGDLRGGAGDVVISSTSTDVEDRVKEGDQNVKVLGFKVKAEGSDVAVNNLKVTLKNEDSVSSDNLSRYASKVTVWVDDEKVGSADVSDFTRKRGTPDEYTKSITLSKAVVRENREAKFYVAITTLPNVNTKDMDTADWNVAVDSIRITDGTGAILTAQVGKANNFSLQDSSVDDKIDIKTSSDNPKNSTVRVKDHSNSDQYLALAFKLAADSDSQDITINTMKFNVDLSNSNASSIEKVVNKVVIKIGGKNYEASLETKKGDNDTSTYVATLEDDDVVIKRGKTTDVKVYVTFASQGNNQANYSNNAKVTVSINPSNIDAETKSDDIVVGGSTKTGADLTLNTSTAIVSGLKWDVGSAGTIVDFTFTVEADDEDFDVLAANITDTVAGTATVGDTHELPQTPSLGVLSRVSGDRVIQVTGGFRVESGNKTTFRVRYNVTGTNGQWAEVNVLSVAGQEVQDDKETSPTAVLNIRS